MGLQSNWFRLEQEDPRSSKDAFKKKKWWEGYREKLVEQQIRLIYLINPEGSWAERQWESMEKHINRYKENKCNENQGSEYLQRKW